MSKRTQEQGEFILPSKAFIPFRRAMIEVANARQEKTMEAAVALHAHITKPIDQGPGKAPRKERLSALNKALKQNNPRWYAERLFHDAFGSIDGDPERQNYYSRPKWDEYTRWKAMGLVLPYTSSGPIKFQAPKKKDLPPIPATTTHFEDECCSVSMDPETRTVRWCVEEGNHTVDRARESDLGQAFFSQLQKIEWTRGTGGHTRYSDEYSEEAAMEHGGNPISTGDHTGPLGQRELEAQYGPALFRKMKAGGRRW